MWGTCLGFQAMLVVMSNSSRALTGSKALYVNLTLQLEPDYAKSRMFSALSSELAEAVNKQPLTYHHHQLGVPVSFYNDPTLGLDKIFNILGTTHDQDGQKIVAAIEHKTLPIYGVAFHPEKTIFDFYPDHNITHLKEAEIFATYLAEFFADETRRSPMNMDYIEVNHSKIQNYPVTVLDGYMGEEYRFSS